MESPRSIIKLHKIILKRDFLDPAIINPCILDSVKWYFFQRTEEILASLRSEVCGIGGIKSVEKFPYPLALCSL